MLSFLPSPHHKVRLTALRQDLVESGLYEGPWRVTLEVAILAALGSRKVSVTGLTGRLVRRVVVKVSQQDELS